MKRFMVHILFLSAAMLFFYSGAYAATTQIYQYDANGNLIHGEGKYYEYNEANQLTKVRHGDQGGPVIAEYVYDYSGQRIKKIENGVITYYIGKHYERQVAGTASTNSSYYFANAERVAKKDPSGDLFYFHSDHLGGTHVMTDASGNMVERIKYYPYGEIREGGSEKYAFTGKEKDKLTDWYYYESRYYNSYLSKFMQPDTIVPDIDDPQELNRYAYVRNNPILYVDPNGHFKALSIAKLAFEIISRAFVKTAGNDNKSNSELINSFGLEISKAMAEAPNYKIVHVSSHARKGIFQPSSWRRAPNTVKSGAAKIGYIAGPLIQTAQDWSRSDLTGSQKFGRTSMTIGGVIDLAGSATNSLVKIPFHFKGLQEKTSIKPEHFGSWDEVSADYFSDKNPVVNVLSDAIYNTFYNKPE